MLPVFSLLAVLRFGLRFFFILIKIKNTSSY
jgi:hypothetical protein